MSQFFRRFTAFLAALCLLAGSLGTVFADGTGSGGAEGSQYFTDSKQAADYLWKKSLFEGTSKEKDGTPVYRLESVPTREQAITMLIRLLGKEQEALTGQYQSPFSTEGDVSPWAKPYVDYAYSVKLTDGTSAATFSGTKPVTATQYITFVLRAMGYDDSKGDFKWSSAWVLSDSLGITKAEYNKQNNDNFKRADMVLISANALAVNMKAKDLTLLEKLRNEGAIKDRLLPSETQSGTGSQSGSGENSGSSGSAGGNTGSGGSTGGQQEPPKNDGDTELPEIPEAGAAPVLTTAKIGDRTANIVTIDMTGKKAVITLAEDAVTKDMSYDDHLAKARTEAGKEPVLSVNGTYFNAYYNTGKPLEYPDNCAVIEMTVVKNGRIVKGGSTTKEMFLGFTDTWKAVVGKVSFSPEVTVAGLRYVPWAVNQLYNDPNAVMLFTEELGYSVSLPSDATTLWISGGTVESVQKGGEITVPKGKMALVFCSNAYTSALRWNENLKAGAEADYSMSVTAENAADQKNWDKVVNAVAGSPGLVLDGKDITDSIGGVEDKLTADFVAGRTFAAEMNDGRLIIGNVTASPRQLAEYLVGIGAKNAVCLDGGGSIALNVNGSRISTPGRKLSNVIHIVEK